MPADDGRAEGSAAEDVDGRQASPSTDLSPPEFLVSEQVMALLRIGDRALNDYDNRGWLNPTKVGRRKLYRAEEVLQILREGTQERLQYQAEKAPTLVRPTT